MWFSGNCHCLALYVFHQVDESILRNAFGAFGEGWDNRRNHSNKTAVTNRQILTEEFHSIDGQKVPDINYRDKQEFTFLLYEKKEFSLAP